MTGSPIFSINLTNRKHPSNLNYHMSIQKSQAILKRFIELKSSVWFTLGSENDTMFCDMHVELFSGFLYLFPLFSFLFPLSSFLFPLSSFPFPDLSRKDRSDSDSRADCRSFSVLTILTSSRPEKISKACFKRRATAVLSWLDCCSTEARR